LISTTGGKAGCLVDGLSKGMLSVLRLFGRFILVFCYNIKQAIIHDQTGGVYANDFFFDQSLNTCRISNVDMKNKEDIHIHLT